MKKVGIAMDAYKLPFFEKRLTEAGYKFTLITDPAEIITEPGDGIHVLSVECNDPMELESLVYAANKEAKDSRK